MSTARQQALASLRGFEVGGAVKRSGLSPAAYCARRLQSWAQRNGKPLTDGQRHVLECCERAAGLTAEAGERAR
jgi:hypothetical protein